ncbi:MAG: TetR family transcriptional regulator [Eubacterium sp.]|nr:TetR family transcriptional regulator [Eubacterium sp.]
MPPKCKFTREEIIEAALEMVKADGIEAVTARALGAKLGTSSKPVFGLFQNMDELLQQVIRAARNEYNKYIKIGLAQESAFKGVGSQYILFAKNEPKLFQLLFMTEQNEKKDAAGTLPMIDDNYREILLSVQSMYGLGEDDSKRLYRHLWIYTHGIAALLATGVCCFSEQEIGDMMTEVCQGLLLKMKESRL